MNGVMAKKRKKRKNYTQSPHLALRVPQGLYDAIRDKAGSDRGAVSLFCRRALAKAVGFPLDQVELAEGAAGHYSRRISDE